MSDTSGFSSASRLALAQMSVEMAAMKASKDQEIKDLKKELARTQSTNSVQSQPLPGTSGTPSRKRHSSNPLAPVAKGGRLAGITTANRYQALTQKETYPDANRPKLNPQAHAQAQAPTYASKVGKTRSFQQAHSTTPHGRPPSSGLEVEPAFSVDNDGPFRVEITVHCLTLNGEKFSGSITPQEAKHVMFKDCLEFGDFTNFDGVRIVYRNFPIITFRLKTPINVDELTAIQRFIFRRVTTRQGRSHVDKIGCKIVGLRNPDRIRGQARASDEPAIDDGTRKIIIEECEYRIPQKVLVDYLSCFGELVSEVKEILFDDGSDPNGINDGTNRSGNYSVHIKLKQDIPQLLPILGRRIKIYYPRIQKLCPNCFRGHAKRSCQSKKVAWQEYIENFKTSHPDINPDWMTRKRDSPLPITGPSTPTADQTSEWVMGLDDTPLTLVNHEDDGTIESEPGDNDNGDNGTQNMDTNSATQEFPDERPPPNRKDFQAPANQVEYSEMLEKLMNAGINLSEAELIITARKNTFNRACREYKKSVTSSKGPEKKSSTDPPKKTRRSTKTASTNYTESSCQ